MKKNTIINLLLGAFLTAMLPACSNGNSDMDYSVTITLDNQMKHDSATLLVLEEGYNKLRPCGTVGKTGNSFVFTGQTDAPRVAIVRWDNDSTKPFYFVLESGVTHISVAPTSWSVTGSKQSTEYLRYVNQRNAIMNLRVATWQEYLKMAADSSLKSDDELRMVRQDSVLNDSLQRITVDRINRGDAVGRIVRERYGQQLDQEHMRMIK